ncbi:MAG: helix-turn-helix transcriptional regulator [Clostridia bacterium]|nr:helix-turn-helix transcriptional regulator [Clostridia bacterium]MBQ9212273.1 helix-turn-helix transcriptional regulator [Clostridia bacterium]
MATVGENIRYLRQKQRLSQKALAKAAGISQSTLSAIESNHQNPSVYTLRELSSALHCKPTTLFSESTVTYYPDDIPDQLQRMLEQMNASELQRMMDFAAGLLAARQGST